MQFKFTHSGSGSRLILLFAGWGADWRVASDIAVGGYDVAVVWDYRTLECDFLPQIAGYEEIVVVAWSFGVTAAAGFMIDHPELPVTATIAVNGTQHPVDDTLGIPPAVFSGTLTGLDERNLKKFNIRMAGGARTLAEKAHLLSDRGVDELREELAAIGAREPRITLWDTAVVASADAIIPPAAQLAAWADEACRTVTRDESHLPDFQEILAALLTDKSLVAQRFSDAEPTYTANATVQREIIDTLCAKAMAAVASSPKRILEIGGGLGESTSAVHAAFPTASVEVWDIALSDEISHPSEWLTARAVDAEIAVRGLEEGSVDLLFTSSTVQWFNSLRRFIENARSALRTGGVVAISTYGPDTMCEIHRLADTSNGFADTAELRRMIPDGYDVMELSDAHRVMQFESPRAVLQHVSLTGVNAMRRASAAKALGIVRRYPLDSESKAPLTYQPIFIILKKL